MKALRASLVLFAMVGFVSPRMLVPCCGDTFVAESAAALDDTTCSACAHQESSLSEKSNWPEDSSHQHPASHSCNGCGLVCCTKVLIPNASSAVVLLLAQTDVLPRTSETLPCRLTADGIFRPPRSLS